MTTGLRPSNTPNHTGSSTIVISPSTVPGTTSGTLLNHYSLLGTAEELLGVPKLGLASSYPAMTSAFNL